MCCNLAMVNQTGWLAVMHNQFDYWIHVRYFSCDWESSISAALFNYPNARDHWTLIHRFCYIPGRNTCALVLRRSLTTNNGAEKLCNVTKQSGYSLCKSKFTLSQSLQRLEGTGSVEQMLRQQAKKNRLTVSCEWLMSLAGCAFLHCELLHSSRFQHGEHILAEISVLLRLIKCCGFRWMAWHLPIVFTFQQTEASGGIDLLVDVVRSEIRRSRLFAVWTETQTDDVVVPRIL